MVPIIVHTVLISMQHNEIVTNDKIATDLKEHVIKPMILEEYLDEKTIFHLNPFGRFVIGGPHGDAHLTGRKIIYYSYIWWLRSSWWRIFLRQRPNQGGYIESGAYNVRQAAKECCNGLARHYIVQVSYTTIVWHEDQLWSFPLALQLEAPWLGLPHSM
ncbi:hypothetical protein L7F22_035656 [Adiantum nelumboides]|nr:hypothetical protein [Adiantum nelumboides]